jgi:DNA-binding transcriptional regulator/RsmH inhibitor MraZ
MPKLREDDHGGYSEHRIDDTGRINLSKGQIEDLGDAIYIINGIEDCVRLCNDHGLEQTKTELGDGQLNTYLTGWARRITEVHVPRAVKPDGNGRVRITGDCLDHAMIGRGTSMALVMFIDEGIYEVWDKGHYAEVSKQMQAEIRDKLRQAAAKPTAGE